MRGVMRAMKLPAGIEIVKVVDRRSYWEAYFEIIEPDLEEGFRSILDWMNPERELFLLDYRRGDVEGGVVLKLMKEKFYLMKGGILLHSEQYVCSHLCPGTFPRYTYFKPTSFAT